MRKDGTEIPVPYKLHLLPKPARSEVEQLTGGEPPLLRGNGDMLSFIELVDDLYWFACFRGLYTGDQT